MVLACIQPCKRSVSTTLYYCHMKTEVCFKMLCLNFHVGCTNQHWLLLQSVSLSPLCTALISIPRAFQYDGTKATLSSTDELKFEKLLESANQCEL